MNQETITLQRAGPRVVRVVKASVRTKTPADYQREHEIALLRLLVPKHRELARELVAVVVAK